MTSEMQIRGVPVEAVDLDDFVSPSTSRPRRSVPRKDYLAMLDANKRLKHEYTATTPPKKSTAHKIGTPSKKPTETQISTLQDEADEQLKTWRILVKHNLISQVNKQICGEKNTMESRSQVENNNDENSRINTRSGGKRMNSILSLNEKPTTQKSMFNIKSDQVQSIFDHIKWLRNSEDVMHSKIIENSTTNQLETENLDIKEKKKLENKNLFNIQTFLGKNEQLSSSINSIKCEPDVSYETDQILKVKVHISNHYETIENSIHSISSCSHKIEVDKEISTSKVAENTFKESVEPVKQKRKKSIPRKFMQENSEIKTPQSKIKKQKNVQAKSVQNEKVLKKEKNTGKQMKRKRRRRNSPDTRVRNFQCTYCCKMFLTQGHLNSHIMTHTGIKPFECNICKKRFSQIGNLQNHLARIHLGVKNYNCKFCGRKFTEQSNVQRHEKYVHDFNRKYECDICKYRFKTKNLLKKHLDIVHIYKMLKCKMCNKKCKVLPSLHVYIVKKKKEETFMCDQCSKNCT